MYSIVNASPFDRDEKSVVRDADGAYIPVDPLNTDWQAYQAWLKAGNKPAQPPPPVTPPA